MPADQERISLRGLKKIVKRERGTRKKGKRKEPGWNRALRKRAKELSRSERGILGWQNLVAEVNYQHQRAR